ncbi:MAG: hypothetical protein KTR15_13890 [Phycisphaeraceae bacterium]|nr:hypothetical protein [Phycisphaeraceae bacterium]
MTPLRLIRRLHAPLTCLLIACLVSAGCSVRQEVVDLGKPSQAYRADNGAVLLGYDVQPTPQVTLEPALPPDYAGWHWLVIEPDTAGLMLKAIPPDATDGSNRIIAVDYEGWGRNARLIPPLLEPGLSENTPPVVGEGGLTELRFVWDNDLRGVRLVDSSGETLPLIRVSPDSATLRIRKLDREAMLDVLRVAAVAGLVVGLVFLGGSVDISN